MTDSETAPDRSCGHCLHFRNDASFLEEAFGGLAALSSAQGSVRGQDGICMLHGRYLSARASCHRFEFERGELEGSRSLTCVYP
jgi:hypothetical protein